MNNEQAEALINAIGAIAEMAMNYYRTLIKNGASEDTALELTKDLQRSLIGTEGKKGGIT